MYKNLFFKLLIKELSKTMIKHNVTKKTMKVDNKLATLERIAMVSKLVVNAAINIFI